MNNLTIFDGDFLLFTATMGNKCLDKEGNPIKVDGKFTYIDKTLEEVFSAADSIINLVLSKTQANYYIGYLGNCKSFRYDIYPEYKGNRAKLIKPKFYNELKEYLVSNWNFILTDNGLEADDAVNIVRNNLQNDYNCIIASSDKDLIKSIKGTYINTRTLEIIETSHNEAFDFFWKSMIIGDVADNIKGIPGKGEVFANKIVELADEMHTSLPMEILDKYIRHYEGLDGIEEFYKNFKCLHILDKFSSFVIPEPIRWIEETLLDSIIIEGLE